MAEYASKFAYDTTFKSFKQSIERSAQFHFDFWNQLRDDRPDIAKLNSTGSKIIQCIKNTESQWFILQKLNSNAPKALKLYAKY